MSSTVDTDDVIEVTDGEITVRKTFTADEFPVPAIRFVIESERKAPAQIRLSEDIPASFPMDSVGFHPEYHSDKWTAFQDNRVEFAGTVDAQDSLETVYGIRIDDESEAEQFMTEPALVDVSGDDEQSTDESDLSEASIGDIVADDDNQVVKDMLTGEGSVPGLDDEADRNAEAAPVEEAPHVEEAPALAGENADAEGEAGDDLDLDFELGLEEGEGISVEDALPDVGDDPADLDLEFDESDVPGQELDQDPEAGIDDDRDDRTPETDVEFGEAGGDAFDVQHEVRKEEVEPTSETTLDEEVPGLEDVDDLGAGDQTDGEDRPPSIDLGIDEAATDLNEQSTEPTEHVEVPTAFDEEDPQPEQAASVGSEARASNSTELTHAFDGEVEGALGGRLAAEIRHNRIDESDLETLQAELSVGPSPSDLAKIDHLQSRVETVASYTDSLESFLDEHGTGRQLIDDFTSDVQELTATVDELDGQIDEIDDTVETYDSRLETNDASILKLTERVDSTDERVSTLDGTVTELDESTSGLESDVADLSERVSSVEDDATSLDQRVDSVEETVGDLSAELEAVAEDVTDIQTWRDELGSMFSN